MDAATLDTTAKAARNSFVSSFDNFFTSSKFSSLLFLDPPARKKYILIERKLINIQRIITT